MSHIICLFPQENFHSLMDLTENARQAYMDMVQQLEKEQQENPNRHPGSVPPYYAHMGHSRTPSACSAISFTSSILSEPISENYPQSEPETDSRGYEIIREALIRDSDGKGTLVETVVGPPSAAAAAAVAAAVGLGGHNLDTMEKVTIIESLDDIDEVREESRDMKGRIRRDTDGEDGDDEEEDEEEDSDDESTSSHNDDDETEYDRDTVRELPHIDSIHSSVVDLSGDILSQHSSKNLDPSADVLSTHSSKNHGDSSNTPTNPLSTAMAGTGGSGDQGEKTLNGEVLGDVSSVTAAAAAALVAGGGTNMHKLRSLDKERIESWVAEAQQHTGRNYIHDGLSGPRSKDSAKDGPGECIDPTTANGRIVGRTSPLKQVLKEDNVKHTPDSNVCDDKPQDGDNIKQYKPSFTSNLNHWN